MKLVVMWCWNTKEQLKIKKESKNCGENEAEEIIEVIITEDFLKSISEKVDFWPRNSSKDEELNYK